MDNSPSLSVNFDTTLAPQLSYIWMSRVRLVRGGIDLISPKYYYLKTPIMLAARKIENNTDIYYLLEQHVLSVENTCKFWVYVGTYQDGDIWIDRFGSKGYNTLNVLGCKFPSVST